MKIQVKLMGMLKEHMPAGGHLELAESSTIEDALRQLGIEAATIQAISVNGSIERDQQRCLADKDEIVVLPPVGGG